LFLLFISYSKARRIVDALRKNKRRIITLTAPTSLPQPPQPRANANLTPVRWMVALAAMDGGAFVVSVCGKHQFGMARASSTWPRAARQTLSCNPPLTPYYYLSVVYYEQRPLAASSRGLVTPYNHRGTHGLSLRCE
jgi:hypothetical protein